MGGNLKDRWSVPSTAVAHEFIDEYMAAANGEYVKVYLYVLRHQDEEITIEQIADALNHTESDVRRALSYWEKPVSYTHLVPPVGKIVLQIVEKERTTPDKEKQEIYKNGYRMYKKLTADLKDCFDETK